ncbi:hypothetical protein [Oceanobacillus bengalensis]|uniref:Spore coat protein YsxE n=1 Tax=Oceanobacillus bengalensis TaxID=1435466 RepID=A0A494Z5Y5_9BACI|nr:hypothetical protein [Oceanobacillus bengalensis]RKQ17948.1 hypothetical protein D8M05_03415 [Oceanobacillus bengalensis]
MREGVESVLNAFQIEVKQIEEITPSLFKVTDYSRSYALKKSMLTEETISNWENVYNLAYSNQLYSILPVYLTTDGKLYKAQNQSIYYLSPWIDEVRTSMDKAFIENFYQELATIHAKTKRSQTVATEKWESSFLSFQEFCKKTMQQLHTAVTLFEKSSYMAPIELLVCTQFRDMEYAWSEINKRIDQFVDFDQDEMKWNYSLCHLNLDQSVIRSTYFLNWEQAAYNNGIMDLVTFFEKESRNYDFQVESFIESFPVYSKINELSLSELQLLSVYLLNPARYIKVIEQYIDDPSKYSMISLVQELQREFRVIRFGLAFSAFVAKEYETVNFDDED